MGIDVDLHAISRLTSPDRAFLSVYLSSPRSLGILPKKLQHIRRALSSGGAQRDEREHFDLNVKILEGYLEASEFESGSLAVLVCWALDFAKVVPTRAALPDTVRVGSTPYIRPLAELVDEYENVAVVVADNRRARIWLVSTAVAGDEQKVVGNVKNHVRKGGWSQQRYERRRDGALLGYARGIVDALHRLEEEESFRRIVLVGGREILTHVQKNLPESLARKQVGHRNVDIGAGEGRLQEQIREVATVLERESEEDLWERIRTQHLEGGLAAVGFEEVVAAARAGRVDAAVVTRDLSPEAVSCRDCESLSLGMPDTCPSCGSGSLFEVDAVNHLVRMLESTGAEVDFVDPLPTLSQVGGVGALLRY